MTNRIRATVTITSDDEEAAKLCTEALRLARPPGLYLEEFYRDGTTRVMGLDVDLAEVVTAIRSQDDEVEP